MLWFISNWKLVASNLVVSSKPPVLRALHLAATAAAPCVSVLSNDGTVSVSPTAATSAQQGFASVHHPSCIGLCDLLPFSTQSVILFMLLFAQRFETNIRSCTRSKLIR